MKKHLWYFIFLPTFLLVSSSVVVAQSERLDSLLNLLSTAPDDTSKTCLYEYIGNEYSHFGDSEKAKEYYLKQRRLSEKLNDLTGAFRGTVAYCDILTWTGQYDSVLMIYQDLIPIVEAAERQDLMMKLNINLGMAHDNKGHFELAVEYFLKGLAECEKTNNSEGIGIANGLLSLTYDRLGFHEKAIACGEQAVEAAKGMFYYERTLANLGEVYRTAKEYDKAEKVFLELIELTDDEPNMFARSLSLLGLGQLYFETAAYKQSEQYLLESLEIFEMADYSFGITGAMYTLGQIEFIKHNFRKSEEWAGKALEVAERDMMYTDIYKCLHLLADIDIVNGNYAEMFQKRNQADSIYDIIVNDKIRQASEELSIKYETEEKNLIIQSLEEEKYLSGIITVISIILLGMILITSFFIVLWTRQKRKKAEMKIEQLEREKQLIATQSLLDGETQERTRLARDLHDGLGSILAAAKYNLSDVRKTPAMELINVELLDKALSLLDDSMSEMRRVAHHLMPESLTRHGLKQSIADFCQSIPAAKFVYYGDEARLDPKMNVMVYRIMHELVSNALKHSGASHILVQIIQDPDRIALTVQDNGCGFDTSAESKGMGMANIRTRVAAYNGNLLVDSMIGVGTEVNVELRVES